jgi:hypothetical protein
MSAPHVPTAPAANGLADAIDAVEARLAALSEALREPGSRGIDTAALEVQRALSLTLDRVQRGGTPLSPALRQRLARASASVASQRESLARATAALDRAIDVLLPREAAVYNSRGAADQIKQSGVARA